MRVDWPGGGAALLAEEAGRAAGEPAAPEGLSLVLRAHNGLRALCAVRVPLIQRAPGAWEAPGTVGTAIDAFAGPPAPETPPAPGSAS